MQASSGSPTYELSCELEPPHSGDVKAVLAVSNDVIASASRDQSVGIWHRTSTGFELKALLNGHHAYVNSLAHIPATSSRKEQYIASGGNSSFILLHSLDTLDTESLHCLVGHGLNVCTLEYSTRRQRLISGSWDRTARVWAEKEGKWECEVVLDGHDEAVWGVAVIDQGEREGCYLTGSADRLINLWSQTGEVLLRIKGSPEPVRSLAVFPGGEKFASACNDGLVRIWDLSGSTVAVLRGHTDYVYEVIMGTEGKVLSCGEDHTVRVWNVDASVSDTLLHPCQTVWAIAQLPNGDIVSAGSDGRVRVWSKDVARKALEEIRKVITDVYSADNQAYTQNVDSIVQRYQSRIQGDSEVKAITIDIDISDDDPPIPLTFLAGSDPREVAEAFGQEHSLSANYINQIEQFIKSHIEARGAKEG